MPVNGSTFRKRYGRGGSEVPLRFYRPVHLRVFWGRVKYVITDRMVYLNDPHSRMWGHAHPYIVRKWNEYVFQPISKEVDKRLGRSYPRRVFLVMMTRIQYMFRGKRYSKWILNRTEYFMQPWLLNEGGKRHE